MGCIVTFDDNVSTGILSGGSTEGVFEYLGYSTDGISAPNLGLGNWPNASQSWGDLVTTNLIESGFYHWKYKSTLDPSDDCYGEVTLIVPISQGSNDIGSDIVLDICSDAGVQDLSSIFSPFAEAAVNPVTYTITPPVGVGAAYNSGGAGIYDDTYDPALEPSYPVTRIFTLNVSPNVPSGYMNSGCENCQVKTQTLTFNVKEQFTQGTATNKAVC